MDNSGLMTYQQLIEFYGGSCTKAAAALGLPKQTVNKWKDREIPFEQQFIIQMKTKGRLKAALPEALRKSA